MRELSNSVKQRFKCKSQGRSLSQIQADLERLGVKGFVVSISPSRVTLLVNKKNLEYNRRNWNEI